MAMATTSPTETNATAFASQPVNALVASEYADYVQKMVLSAHEQREYDETEWLLVLADAIEAIESTTPTTTTMPPAKPVQAILQALVEDAFSHETQATAIVSQLGDELVRASHWVLSGHEKIASLEEALDETQHELEQRNAQVAALEAALMEAKAKASAIANEKTESHSDTASSTGSSSTDSKRAPSRGPRKISSCSSSSSSGSARPSWNSSTRGKIGHASRPAASRVRVRARASMSTAISTATAITTTTGGPTTTATRTKTAAQRTTLPPKPKKVSKPTQLPQSKTQGPKPDRMPALQPQPPTPLPHLEWSVLECGAEQERAGHSLSLILQQLQEISAWCVYFEEDELWVLPGDRTSAVSLAPIDSASVVNALVVQTKLLDTLKRDCHGKLRGVSHASHDRPLLVERQQKLLGEIDHVRTLVTDLITTLREVAGCEEEEDEVVDQEHVRVWQCRMPVAPKPMMSSVREQLDQRSMVNVSMTALESVEVTVRGFHIECLGEWAASLQTDDIHVSDVEMELGAIVLGEVTTRIEKQVEACQWLYTSAPLAIKFKDAVTKIDDKLAFFSKALARSQDLYWCEGLLEQLGSETETIDVHTA